MLYDVLEAEARIAYAQEGERLAGVPFPSLRRHKPAKGRLFKVGGLWFFRLGRYQFSFCVVSDNEVRP